MTPQERQLIDDLFGRLSKLEGSPRDPDAFAAIAQGLRGAPNAVYPLVQTVLLQDEALKRANHRIQELEAGNAGEQHPSGGFLDSMRDAIFGQGGEPHGSVPNVPPPSAGASRPVWNSGQAMQQAQYPGQYSQGPYGQPAYGQPYGGPQGPMGGGPLAGAMGGGGGSFLGTAAAAAAGVVGGSLLLNSIRSMMGGSHYGFGDPSTVINEKVVNESPWGGNQSGSDLARDAGINDINSADARLDDNSRAGLFDNASADDRDDMDLDSDDFGNDDFGNDGGSDDV